MYVDGVRILGVSMLEASSDSARLDSPASEVLANPVP
jgi:hypothetical protein